MLILRAHPKGGRPLKPNHFSLHEDKDGNFGYLIGYMEDGDKVLIPLSLAEQIANTLGSHRASFKNVLNKLKPKLPWKERMFIWLFGRRTLDDLKEYYQIEQEDR